MLAIQELCGWRVSGRERRESCNFAVVSGQVGQGSLEEGTTEHVKAHLIEDLILVNLWSEVATKRKKKQEAERLAGGMARSVGGR